MNLTRDTIRSTLQTVKYPGYSRDIVSFGLVKDIGLHEGAVRVIVQLNSNNPQAARQIKDNAETALRALPGVTGVEVEVEMQTETRPASPAAPPGSPDPWANQQRVPGVQRVVAIASGKGGVGKSTVAVNLACALRHQGASVGLLDCDIYGPSIPFMMGLNQRPTISDQNKLVPPANYGVKLMSIGFLLDGDQPVIWRGPMIAKTIQQFLFSVDWGALDLLLVDLPPGTGDAQLSLCQTVPLDGGLIVTTPQEAALGVARKGIAMFERVHVPVLGIVENMSYFTAPSGERLEIFGHGGGQAEAARLNLPFLGEVPLFTAIREGGDRGVPVVVADPASAPAAAFLQLARKLQPPTAYKGNGVKH